MKPPLKSGWCRLVLAFATGSLLAVSFPKFNLRWLAWIAPGLILCATHGQTIRNIFWTGFVGGLGNYLVSLYWLLLIPFPWHALAGYAAMCGVLSCCMAGWCVVCWLLLPRSGRLAAIAWPFFCAAAWVAMEMLTARLFTGFPWNFIGASQVNFSSFIQIASITGVYGVSFLVVWMSVSLVNAIWFARGGGKLIRAIAFPLPAGLVVVGVLAFGMHRLSQPEESGRRLKIALVQPSIPQHVYWDPAEKTNRFLKLMELSREALRSGPDLIVWPEAAIPDMFTRSGYLQDAIASLLQARPTWMVMGAADTSPNTNAVKSDELDHFNGAFLIDPKGQLVDRYYKRHLVPFGEYMPGARSFQALAKLRSAGAGIVPGKRAAAFHIEDPPVKFPVLICFEDMFPGEVRQRVDADTDFMLNLTSDAWFGESAAQWQHAEGAAFRAVENGVPLVRCCNNGLTCWIDAKGRLHDVYFADSRNIYAAGYKIVEVPLRSARVEGNRTFYDRQGDWFGWICAAIILAVSGVSLLSRRR